MKFLVNPLGWYLLLQCAGLLAIHQAASGRSRRVVRALILLTALLAVAAMPLTTRGLKRSLRLGQISNGAAAPAFIFVLSGGYLVGRRPDLDVLVAESHRRAMHAVEVWRHYPGPRLVFSGGAYEEQDVRETDRVADLMAKVARSRGVPASAVLLEPRSRNTREHPIEALKLAGVTGATPVGIVTSEWHMRRARREFCRYFQHVHSYSVPPFKRAVRWRDIVPQAGSLDGNTTLVREWIAVVWYASRGVLGRRTGKCRRR